MVRLNLQIYTVDPNRKDTIGPDTQNVFRIITQGPRLGQQGLVLDCFASELQLRGNTAISQPHFVSGAILCWNGEVTLFLLEDFHV